MDNEDFGYYKVTVERPDRRKAQFSRERLSALRFDKSLNEVMEPRFRSQFRNKLLHTEHQEA